MRLDNMTRMRAGVKNFFLHTFSSQRHHARMGNGGDPRIAWGCLKKETEGAVPPVSYAHVETYDPCWWTKLVRQ